MNLESERKIKFWLSTITKVLVMALIIFKLVPFLMDMATDSSAPEVRIIKEGKENESAIVNVDIPIEEKSSVGGDKPQETPLENEEKNGVLEKRKPKGNSIGVFIFDGDTVDKDIVRQMEVTILEQYDTKSVASSMNKTKLMVGDIEGYHETDKICIGKVSYTFKNKASMTSCELRLDFDTYDTDSGLKLKEYSKSISRFGIGFSEKEAQANAIKKIH